MKWLCYGLMSALLLSGCEAAVKSADTAPAPAIDTTRAAQLNVELGMLYLHQEQRVLAKQKLLKALALAPDLPETHVAMAQYFAIVGQLEAANQQYQQALTLAPHSPSVSTPYALFLCDQHHYAQAEHYFQIALQDIDYPQLGWVYEQFGLCLLRAGQPQRAQDNFQEAIRQNPQLAIAYLKLAELAWAQQEYERATQWLQYYQKLATPTQESLQLALQLAEQAGDKGAAASIRLQLGADTISS